MIVRAQRNTNFTIMSNVGLRDERLSYKARGLLAYLLSMPDHWRTSERHLAAKAPDGRHAVSTGLKELERAGYLIRQRIRLDDGTFDWHSVIYDEPQQAGESSTVVQFSDHGLSDHGKASRGKASRGKARQIVSTKKVNTERVSTEKVNPHQSVDDDDALRAKLREVGVRDHPATLRHYQQQVERYGLAAVLEGLERAAAHGTQNVRLYVDKCIKSAAAGESGADDRPRDYIPTEYADIIIH